MSNCDNMASALGITETRYKEIAETTYSIMKKNEGIRYSQAAEQVTKRLDLTTNEIFFLGVLLGGYAQFKVFVESMSGVFVDVEEFENVPKGTPVAKMAYA